MERDVPTPEQIAHRCAEIQSGWTPAERYSRLVGHACFAKHKADGVEQAARFELDGKLADRRKAMRQA